ncbi:phosphoribosylamine--glycine ligase [Acidiplasma sp.]|uniref:phosphoribosylamine--glycine ligase n=1 Tax=Acidiplasma sp. TaxID=1872114 RepID=UPI002586D24E|nr:phosphoribosylamine--glycine ligase [Acidiplasma sp.]
MNILLVGSGGREDAIARKINEKDTLYSVILNENPSIIKMSHKYIKYGDNANEFVLNFARENNIDIAFISPDDILNTDLNDYLLENHIPTASPSRKAARIETSKEYMRYIMEKYKIEGNIENYVFDDEDSLKKFFNENNGEYAVKPIGLTGGKGVRVMGLQLSGKDEALDYARYILNRDGKVLIEKKESGEEFSLQALPDGKHLVFMPIAQDYKRLYEGDTGPNTGGMGSITDSNFSLPFLRAGDREIAEGILKKIIYALREEGNPFKGVIYGQFMSTNHGIKVIEINSRFADPEGINVLTLLRSNIVDIFLDIYSETLKNNIKFEKKATVLKYIVPPGYGINPVESELKIGTNLESENFKLYYASVSGTMQTVKTGHSRALALTGISDSIYEASDIVEEHLKYITGSYYIRHDIGTREMIENKIKNSGLQKPWG